MPCHVKIPGHILYGCLDKILANDRRRYKCNVSVHWLKTMLSLKVVSIISINIISMAKCKTAISPAWQQWRYCRFAPSHRSVHYQIYIWLEFSMYRFTFTVVTQADIWKSTGHRSSTGGKSGGPMKTVVVPVFLSGKKIPVGSTSMGALMLKKKWGPVKVLEDQ